MLASPPCAAALSRWAEGCFGSEAAVRASLRGLSWPMAANVTLELAGPEGARVVLALDAALVSGLLGGLLGTPVAPPHGPPSEGEHGVLTYALAWLLSELPLSGWTVLARARAADAAPAELAHEVRLEWAGRAGSAWIWADEATMLSLDRAMAGGQPTAITSTPARLASLPCRLPVVVARFGLPRDELETGLVAGDIMVVPGALGEPRLEVGRGAFPSRGGVGERAITITGPFDSQGALKMTHDLDDGTSHPTIVDQLPLEITVELGRIELKGADVVALGEGDVVTLDRPVGASVDLRVGGKLLGRGALVDVEGETGVRLTEVY